MPTRFVDTGQPVNWSHPLSRGLSSCWLPLHGNSGGNKLFDVGNAYRNNGTLTSNCGWSRLGLFPAVELGATTSSAIAIDRSILSGTSFSPVTFVATASTRAAGVIPGAIISQRGLVSTSQRLVLRTNGYNVEALAGGGGVYGVSSIGDVIIGQWMHMAASFAATNSRTAYLNGVPGTTNTTTCSPTVSWDAATIGVEQYSTLDSPWRGLIGAVWYYSRALTSSEVRQHYLEWVCGYPNLLNWIEPRAWSFGSAVQGGGGGGSSFQPAWAINRSGILGGIGS